MGFHNQVPIKIPRKPRQPTNELRENPAFDSPVFDQSLPDVCHRVVLTCQRGWSLQKEMIKAATRREGHQFSVVE